MNTPSPSNLVEITNTIRTSTPDLGLIMLAGFSLILIGFGFLMYRQARQMTQVLPTSLSPTVQVIVFGYVLLTLATFSFILASIV